MSGCDDKKKEMPTDKSDENNIFYRKNRKDTGQGQNWSVYLIQKMRRPRCAAPAANAGRQCRRFGRAQGRRAQWAEQNGGNGAARRWRRKVSAFHMGNPHIVITMLGGFQIEVDGRPVLAALAQSRKVTLLLQYLLLERDRRISHKELTDSLWGAESTGNPDMALRAILHRFRGMIDQENLRALQNCIVTNRGSYQWNGALDCDVDIYALQKLLEQGRTVLDDEQKAAVFERVLALYGGKLLPGSAGETWVERRSVQLHAQYQATLLHLLEIYKKADRQADIVRVCRRGMEVDRYNEQLYIEAILAYNALGEQEKATEISMLAGQMGYLHLNTSRAREINTAYRRLLQADRSVENDVDKIFDGIEREDDAVGAFLCNYAIFKEIYKLHYRMMDRYGTPMFLALVTIVGTHRSPDPGEIAGAMEALEKILRTELRRCDVISQYSGTQFVALLTGATTVSGECPLERVKTEFYRSPAHASCALSYRLRAPELRRAPRPGRRVGRRKAARAAAGAKK